MKYDEREAEVLTPQRAKSDSAVGGSATKQTGAAQSISLIIPAYNEEHHLKACLESVAAQTVQPDEVIVVDNNSTDKTTAIAKKYPFVRVIHETRQGQVFAQAKGFGAAAGDILARIDSDTILPPTWVARIKQEFRESPRVVAVTGGGEPYDVPLKRLGSWIFRTYHHTISSAITGKTLLWGANCAIRADVWPSLKREQHLRPDIWEDYDMSFHLDRYGQIKYLDGIAVGCSFRAAHKPLLEQTRYQFRAVRTVALHAGWLRTTLFLLAWATLYWVFPFTLIDHYMWKWRGGSSAS